AITGDNLSHFGGASPALMPLADALLQEINSNTDICFDYKLIKNITVNLGDNFQESNVNRMDVESFFVNNGGSTSLKAANSITLKPVFDSKQGSVSDISIIPEC